MSEPAPPPPAPIPPTDEDGRIGGLEPEELEYYSDGAWYDAEYVHIRGDIHHYMNVAAAAKGPILELACGTGRLTIPMAEVGAEVVGVDVAPGMIAQANAKRDRLPPGDRARCEFVVGDMRTLRLGRRFDKVILAFNTILHMTRDEDLEATLRTAAEHLRPRGLFHVDLHTPHPAVVPRDDPSGRYDPQQMIDPRSRDRYIVTENNQYDPRTQINTMRFYYQQVDVYGKAVGPERCRKLRLRVLFPRELDTWLHRTGFEIVGDWDDLDGTTPFSGEGGRRVLTARLRHT